MRKKNYMKFMLGLFGAMFLFSSCKSIEDDVNDKNVQNQEEVDANKENEPTDVPDDSSEEENPPTIVVESGPVIDEEAILKYFYGQTKEELTNVGYLFEELSETDGQPTNFICIKDGMELGYTYEHGENSNYIYYMDNRENAGKRYKDVLENEYIDNEISQRLENMFPNEYYKNYLPKDVRKKCQPFAEACGYGDAKVDIYAMKHEVLNNYAEYAALEDSTSELIRNAPDPDYDYNYVDDLERRILQERKKENSQVLDSLVTELENYNASQDEKEIAWTEEHDAYLLVYQTKVEEYVIDSAYYSMMFVFVPAYDRIVYAEAYRSLVVTETVEEEKLLALGEIFEEMMRIFKITNPNDLILQDVSLAYSPRYESVHRELDRRMIEPCWRIDYALSENIPDSDGTIFMSTKDGSIFKYKNE